MYCRKCGNWIDDNDQQNNFCPNCGTPRESMADAPTPDDDGMTLVGYGPAPSNGPQPEATPFTSPADVPVQSTWDDDRTVIDNNPPIAVDDDDTAGGHTVSPLWDETLFPEPPIPQDEPVNAKGKKKKAKKEKKAKKAGGEKGGKKGKTVLLIVLAVLFLALLGVGVYFGLDYFEKKNDTTEETTAEEESTETAEETAADSASADVKEDAFRNAIQILDTSSYPDCEESGYIDTLVKDLDGDKKAEYIAFYADFANDKGPMLDVHLYTFESGKAQKTGELEDKISLSFDGSGVLSVCAYTDEKGLCLNESVITHGGGTWENAFIRITVRDGKPVMDVDYVATATQKNRFSSYEEKVSGETFENEDALLEAVKAAGLDAHWHELYVGGEKNRTDAVEDENVSENHIFVMHRDRGFTAASDSGYVHTY